MERYDLIVIGGGPAGYNSAEYASKKGMKVLLIEKEKLGGTCLNAGCIPTKAFLYATKTFDDVKGEGINYGISCGKPMFSHSLVIDKKNEMVQILAKGIENRLKKNKIKVVNGTASIQRSGDGVRVQAAGEACEGKYLLIATGSSPSIPPIKGVDQGLERGFIITSNEILDIRELPRRLMIVGAGVIGLEMAAYFQGAGAQVTVVETMDKVLGQCDREVSDMVQKNLEKKGVRFYLSSSVTAMESGTVYFIRDGEEKCVECDKVLMAVGRKANLNLLGLQEMGIETAKGVITVDDRCRTNVANVFAAGDVVGKISLAHVGYREGEVAVNTMCGEDDEMDYSAVCSVVYTNPEAAFVGLSEEEARQQGYKITVKKISINFSGRHVIEHGLDDGICKIVIDQKKGIMIGAAVMSAYASEYIYAAALMIQNKIPVESIKKTIFPHPTVCEIIREALME